MLSAAALIGLTAGMLSGGSAVVGTPEAVAKTQAQVRAADMQKDRAPTINRFAVDMDRLTRIRFGHRSGPRRWPGLGWPVAHDRRQARKRRNAARNRRAQRGGR